MFAHHQVSAGLASAVHMLVVWKLKMFTSCFVCHTDGIVPFGGNGVDE